jgi:hypothetical protein
VFRHAEGNKATAVLYHHKYMAQNRMYNLDKKGEGLLIMGKNSTQNILCETKKYIQRSSLTKETM